MAKVFVPNQNFDVYFNNPRGKVGRWLALRGRAILSAAKRQVGVRTGALRSSLHMRHSRDTRGQFLKIGSDLSYARLHHEGTRPHLIKPKEANGVLVFRTRGQLVITHLVRHPGTRPNRYLTDNLRLIR